MDSKKMTTPTDAKVCSGSVPMLFAARPAKLNPQYWLVGAIQSTNPQFWGTTYVPYEVPSRLYPNEPLRPSFYDEGCFSAQCDLQTLNTCTRTANIDKIVTPNWNAVLDPLYTSTDAWGSSARARHWAELHNTLAASTSLPMSGMSSANLAISDMPFKTSSADLRRSVQYSV